MLPEKNYNLICDMPFSVVSVLKNEHKVVKDLLSNTMCLRKVLSSQSSLSETTGTLILRFAPLNQYNHKHQ